MTPYVAPQYWLNYEYGFVRRALPGAVLHFLVGDQPPSYTLVKVAGVGLSAAAVLAVLVLAALLARRAANRWAAVAVGAAAVGSPLGLSLYARDIGRTDALGVVSLVVLVWVPWRRLPAPARVVGVAAVSSVAVAAEEFLIAFVLPVALVVAWSSLASLRCRLAWTTITVLPSMIAAVLSAAITPPSPLLTKAAAAARSAGVPPPVSILPGQADHDSVSRLKYGLVENMRAYYAITTPVGVVVTTVTLAAVYLLLVGLVWHLLGRTLRDREVLAVIAVFAAGALALSVVGIDFRRWWALAAVAALAMVLQLTSTSRRSPQKVIGPKVGIALSCLAVAGAILQGMPLMPTETLGVPQLIRRTFG